MGFRSKKVIGYSHNIGTTILPVDMSCQAGYDHSSQDSQLGKTDNYFSLPVACIEPFSTTKVSQRDEDIRLVPG